MKELLFWFGLLVISIWFCFYQAKKPGTKSLILMMISYPIITVCLCKISFPLIFHFRDLVGK